MDTPETDSAWFSNTYQQILNELRDALMDAQPTDTLQFCFNYFSRKLEEERTRLLSRVSLNCDVDSFASIPPAPLPQSLQELPEHLLLSDDDDLPDDDASGRSIPAVDPVNYNRARRVSISAESMAPSKFKDYVTTVYPKTDEQRRRIVDSMSGNFLFKNLDEEQHRDVIDAMMEKHAKVGEKVIEQGGEGDYFYVVETGALDVYISKDGVERKVLTYGPGGSFGELALMYNAPRAATIVATSDCVLWALDRVTFRRILMENTSRKRRMYEAFLEEVPLLAELQPYERHKIADALESVYFADGEAVVKQGDIGENFYFIEDGEAIATKRGENGEDIEVLAYKKGDYFGELALLNNQPRAATVRAKGRLKCATLGKKAFTRLLGPLHEILKRNSAQYVKLYAQTQQM
ncbi:uncharacterized protein VTP21DRAFT_8450 [Calcarisporiella thermophila]|uniref:uncharacterized protein n=1 Tax=Calcarisporiella thermophila TaxID=911321 RepID=UPI0037430ADF